MNKTLSRRQADILNVIRETLQKRGFPPSIREIGEAVGLCSSSTVHMHLKRLEAKRYIRRDPSKPRSIQLVDEKPTRTITPNTRRVQALEEVARLAQLVVRGERVDLNQLDLVLDFAEQARVEELQAEQVAA